MEEILDRLEPITLDRMDAIKLMNRVDTKYVTTLPQLRKVLASAASSAYYVLVTGSGDTADQDGSCHGRIAEYDTVYFDTPSQDMYLVHHSGKLVRRKVRSRVYRNSGIAFLEVKRKNNHSRTKKKRIGIPVDCIMQPFGTEEAVSFVSEKSGYSPETLSPAVRTSFKRITIVNRAMTERVTIDMGLHFHSFRSGLDASLEDIVVIELKQDGLSPSEMKDILLSHRIFPMGFSKYCIGTVLTTPSIKSNRFKLKVNRINKLRKNASSSPSGL